MLKNEELAAMLAITAEEVEKEKTALENEGIIIGYSAIINEEKFDKNAVTALIELKVSPQSERGYAVVANQIAQFKEVDSVQLMSGSFDLAVTIKGSNLRDVALFVSDRLAAMDGVLSTATHFILERFKEKGVQFSSDDDDERSLTSP
jgi:DNA-binding Lrp family transcriptional regulator